MSTETDDSTGKSRVSRGFKSFVDEAKREIDLYPAPEAIDRVDDGGALFVDVRETSELDASGRIPDAIHAPRGMLEFHIDPESPYYMEEFGDDRELIFYCAVGGRSALAAGRAKEMGIADVASVEGGFKAWQEAGGPVEELRPTMSADPE